MNIRRIVTGHDASGKALIVSDERLENAFESLPGFANTLLWTTDNDPQVGPSAQRTGTTAPRKFLPDSGTTRLMTVSFPPDSATLSPAFEGAAYATECETHMPGFLQVFEADAPGMHTTDSVDYGILLEGELWLELDEGREVRLAPHDLVVQNGTRHAWRNKSTQPATMLFILIGAQRV